MGETPLSACVITFQEADRVEDCVRSMAFCEEVLVVDSGSTDGTREIAEAAGARVVTHTPFPGHRQQKQWAVEQAHHDWVLCLDADERVTEELRDSLVAAKRDGLRGAAYEMPRRNHYLGRVMRFGLVAPDRKVRVFDRRRARWGGTNPHDRVEVESGGEVTRLPAPIEHLSYRDFAHHRRVIDSFTAIAARALRDQGRRPRWSDLLLRPPAIVLKALVLKLGVLDGWRGLLGGVMAGYYDWLKYWRLRREWRR